MVMKNAVEMACEQASLPARKSPSPALELKSVQIQKLAAYARIGEIRPEFCRLLPPRPRLLPEELLCEALVSLGQLHARGYRGNDNNILVKARVSLKRLPQAGDHVHLCSIFAGVENGLYSFHCKALSKGGEAYGTVVATYR